MALDPLKFAVQIQDDATEQLKKIKLGLEQLLSGGLKINISSISADSAAVDAATKKLVKSIQESVDGAFDAIKTNNFGSFASNIKRAADNMSVLAEQTGKFGEAISGNQNIKDFITTLNQQILDVGMAIANLNKLTTKGGGVASGGKGGSDASLTTYNQNLEKVKVMLNKVEEAEAKVQKASEMVSSKDLPFDPARIQEVANALTDVKRRLTDIQSDSASLSSKGVLSGYLGGDFKSAIANATALKRDVTEVSREQAKAEREATQSANSYASNVERMRQALYSLQEARAKVTAAMKDPSATDTQIQGARQYLSFIDAWEKKLRTIQSNPFMMHENGWQQQAFGPILRNLVSNANDFGKQISGATKGQEQLETNQRKYNDTLQDSWNLWNRLEQSMSKGQSLGVDTSKTEQASQQLQDFINKMMQFDGTAGSHRIAELNAEFSRLSSELGKVAGAQEKLNAVTERQNAQNAKNTAKEQQRENEAWAKSMNDASIEAAKLEVQIQRLKAVESSGMSAGIDTSALSSRIAELQQYKDAFDRIAAGFRGYGKTGEVTGSASYQNTKRFADAEADSIKKLTAEHNKAAREAENMAQKQNQLSEAIRSANSQATRQSQILGDLRGMMTQYLSVYAAASFLREMTQITGELELQKRSLEVIMDNASKADELYSQIRDMSQLSPHTFQDLLKSTRQLSAFGVETKNVFGTMKALSDIGAGLSVDVQRLILAYGHTRSYGYLSGIQNRQFETAGIDLMGELAKYYNRQAQQIREQGGVVANTSRMDLYKRMRKREISFEDVENVILGMDKPGGKFYNMQERQYNTLGGKLRNLRNNYNIMMSEMGESNKGLLTGTVNMLNHLTGNWQKYANILKTVLIPLGAVKLAMMAVNRVGITQAANISASVMSKLRQIQNDSKYMAVTARLAGVPTGKIKGFSEMQGLRVFRRDMEKSLANGDITKQQLRMMALNGRLGESYRVVAGQLSGLTKEQAKNLASLSGLQRMWAKVRLGFGSLGYGLANVGRGIVAALMSPVTWIMAAIAAVTALINHHHQIKELSSQYGKMLGENGANDQKSIDELINTYSEGLVRRVRQSGTYKDGKLMLKFGLEYDEEALRNANLTGAIADMKEKLQAMSPMYDKDLIDIDKMNSQYEQFKAIMEKMESLRRANDIQEAYSGALGTANKRSGGWFNDDFITNLKDYESAIRKGYDRLAKITEEELNEIDQATGGKLSEMMRNGGFSDIRDALAQMYNNILNGDRSILLKGSGPLTEYYLKYAERGKWLEDQIKNVRNDAKYIADAFNNIIKNEFEGDVAGASDFIALQLKNLVSQSGITDGEVIRQMYDAVLSAMGLNGQYFKSVFDQQQLVARFNQEISGKITNRTTKEQADAIMKEAQDSVVRWAESIGMDLANTGAKDGTLFVDAMASAMKEAAFDYDWQDILIGADNGIIKANHSLIQSLKGEDSLSSAADVMQKEFKSLWEGMNTNDTLANTGLEKFFGIENGFKPEEIADSILGDPKEVLAVLQERLNTLENVASRAESLIKQMRLSPYGVADAENMQQQYNEWIKPAIDNYTQMIEIVNALMNFGLDIDYQGKNKNSGYKAEREKRWDERIRVMKEAYDWYDKWEKKVGEGEAFNKVNQRYSDVFKEWKTEDGFLFDAKNVKDYLSYVEQIRDEALKLYKAQKDDEQKNNGEEALRVYRQAVAILEEGGWDNFTRAAEEFNSIIEKTLDDMQSRWTLFDSIKKATNDELLAFQIAGINNGELQMRNMADGLRYKLEDTIRGTSFEGLELNMSFSEGQIRKALEDSLPIGDGIGKYAIQIDGIIKLYQEWQKAQKDATKSDAEMFAQLIGSTKTYDKQIADINQNLRDQKEANARLLKSGKITTDDYMVGNSIADAQAEYRKMKLSAEYANVFNHALGMTGESFRNAADAIENKLETMRIKGVLSLEEYESEMERLEDVRRSFQSGPKGAFGAFVTGGYQGMADFYSQREYVAREQLARVQTGSEEYTKLKDRADSYRDLKNASENAANSLNNLSVAISKIQSGMNFMSDFFNNIGESELGEAFSSNGSIGTVLSGVTSGASIGGIYGALIGGALGIVSAVFKSDAKEAQRVEDNRKLTVQKLEDIYGVLEDIRNNSLGYAKADDDTLAKLKKLTHYNAPEKLFEPIFGSLSDVSFASIALGVSREAYMAAKKAASSGSVYAIEYATLLAQRDKKVQELNDLKSDNKDGQNDADILAAEERIQELKQEISTFTRDMAKELWSIDVKGWASQISDSLVTAFENGDSAAKAYKNTVNSILRDISDKIINMAVVEPILGNLQNMLFGYTDKNGKFVEGSISTDDWVNNPSKAIEQAMSVISEFMGKNGEGIVESAYTYLSQLEALYNQMGFSMRDADVNTLSASMQGTTEETSELLAAYVNAARQDISVIRLQQEMFISEMWPDYAEQFAQQLTVVQSIDTNVRLIMQMMRNGEGAMYDKIDSIDSRFRNITDGTNKVYMQ